jgi:hypothetical protein
MFPIAQLASFIPLLTVAFYLHPIHVSVTEVDFDKKEQSLQIMMRVFVEDLETTLRNTLNDPELDILEPAGDQTTDRLAEAYLNEHFKISLDGKPQKMKYLGHEREADAFIFYIEVSNVKPWKTISVVNDIIMSTYSDQSNLVHVYVDDNVKSLRLTANTPADHLTFDNQ